MGEEGTAYSVAFHAPEVSTHTRTHAIFLPSAILKLCVCVCVLSILKRQVKEMAEATKDRTGMYIKRWIFFCLCGSCLSLCVCMCLYTARESRARKEFLNFSPLSHTSTTSSSSFGFCFLRQKVSFSPSLSSLLHVDA